MAAARPAWSDDDIEAFRDLAHTFFEKECAPHEERWGEQQHVDREVWLKAGELGLLCPSIPAEYGGGGGTFAHEAVMAEEQVRTGAGSLGTAVHSTIVAHYIYAYGTEDQKQRWLPKLASGEFVGAVAMSEPSTGSDLQNVKTRAIRNGDEYVIDGSKTFISNGLLAELIIVVTKTDPDNAASGISLVVVETEGLAGFARGRVLKKIGQHGQDTAELFFDAVRVPSANLLGDTEGQGFIQLMNQLPQERLILAVAAATAIEAALAETVKYTKDRHVFGKPIASFQNTKFKLAEVATTALIGRVFIDDCIAKHLRAELDIPTASMAKYWLTEQQCDVADECLQLFGGYGYMAEYPISRMFTDSRVQKIYGGTNEIMKEIISRFL
ncbi:MAG: acyl-CoA dehydrogenase family protein [Actinomycetota bacterium]|nr:acyl-CoA dehydrogenase family protein [Actinomycetota bacterium]